MLLFDFQCRRSTTIESDDYLQLQIQKLGNFERKYASFNSVATKKRDFPE